MQMKFLIITIMLCLALRSTDAQTHFQVEAINLENVERLQEVGSFGRGSANALDWRPDGELLAVGSATGIWMFDPSLNRIEETSIKQPVTDLAWSPDGSRIAAVSNLRDRCTIQVWDAEFTKAQLTLDDCGGEAMWNAAGTYLAIFNFNPDNNEVLLINVITSGVTTLPGQDGAWSPSGNVLFTRLRTSRTYYDDPPTIYTWNVETKESLFALDITGIETGNILWGNDDRTLAIRCREVGAEDDAVSVGLCSLDVRTGEITLRQEIASYGAGQAPITLVNAAWNDHETLLASVHERFTRGFLNYILVLDTHTGERANIGYGNAFDWKPQTDELTAIIGNGEIRIYSAKTGEIVAESQWFSAPINMIAIRPNTYQIASTGFGYEQNTNIWDIQYSWNDPLLSFYAEPAEIVDYTVDGQVLIAGGTIITDIIANQQIDAFDPNTGERIRNIAAFYDQGASPFSQYWNADYTETLSLPDNIQVELEKFPAYISWSPDYSIVAIVEQSIQEYVFRIRTWDAVTGEFINQFSGGMYAFQELEWSPDSTRIAVLLRRPTGSGNDERGLRVFSVMPDNNYDFDRNDYEVFAWINMYESPQQVKAAWNSDGTLLAIVLPDVLEIHDLDGDGSPLISLPAYDIVDLEWSEDDRFIAGGSDDGTIRLWGVPVGQ